jgi:hypothetical protein
VKKFLMFVMAIFMASCANIPQSPSLDTLAANAKSQIAQACMVVQPTLVDLKVSLPTDPNLALLVSSNAQLCAAASSLDPVNAQTLINTLIPQALTLVDLIPVDPGTKIAIRIALGAASVAISNWLMVYNQPVTPASAPGVAK